jgi:hypothetical protein
MESVAEPKKKATKYNQFVFKLVDFARFALFGHGLLKMSNLFYSCHKSRVESKTGP